MADPCQLTECEFFREYDIEETDGPLPRITPREGTNCLMRCNLCRCFDGFILRKVKKEVSHSSL